MLKDKSKPIQKKKKPKVFELFRAPAGQFGDAPY